MTNRERVKAILNYQNYDRMPLVHFGYWDETLEKWYHEGHITEDEWKHHGDSNQYDKQLSGRLGFDFNWQTCFYTNGELAPSFKKEDLGPYPSGGRMIRNRDGVTVLQKDDAGSIPAEIDHLLTDRESWEEHYKWRLQFSPDRVPVDSYKRIREENQDIPLAIHCGSLFGFIRNIMGVEGISYLFADDEDLYDEIIDTVGNLCYQNVEYALNQGLTFDRAHFWEDICFKNGPLVIPSVFKEKVGPHYKKITDLLVKHDITTISLDCDGCIDSLIPTWLENGVNTMFPIEVGTWNASIAPWREKYGQVIKGVGGMNKTVFAKDKAAVDEEVERLARLIDLGGYIPCPDHRIAPDAIWENVQYYCEQMHKRFG